MKRNDQISEDVIKIFNNTKESIRKDVSKWTKDAHIAAKNQSKKHSTCKNHKSVVRRAPKHYESCSKEHSYQ